MSSKDNNSNKPSESLLRNMVSASMLDNALFISFRNRSEKVIHSLATVSIVGISLAVTLGYTTSKTTTNVQYIQMMMVAFSTVMVGWMMWSFVAKVMCNVWGSTIKFRDMMRVTGIAYSPGALILFATIPILDQFILFFVWVWILIAVTQSIKSASNIGFMKAAIPGILGWFMSWVILPFLMLASFFFPVAN